MEKCILRKYVVQLSDNSFVGDYDFTCTVNDLCNAKMFKVDEVSVFMSHAPKR